MHGGKREGAGRPKGSVKENPNPRAHRQLRAHDDEWEVLKEFMQLVRRIGVERARQLLK